MSRMGRGSHASCHFTSSVLKLQSQVFANTPLKPKIWTVFHFFSKKVIIWIKHSVLQWLLQGVMTISGSIHFLHMLLGILKIFSVFLSWIFPLGPGHSWMNSQIESFSKHIIKLFVLKIFCFKVFKNQRMKIKLVFGTYNQFEELSQKILISLIEFTSKETGCVCHKSKILSLYAIT